MLAGDQGAADQRDVDGRLDAVRSSTKARCPLPGEAVVLGAWGMARAGGVRGEPVRWRW
ncbi:hypothetical protein ACIOHS_14510 [Streptomyces sp. NPDC088253]|uniref:hypothetical protein n=1 Tax=Streptomyces sp. NPDC088253 TaxID=3365846 RepID=UPI0037F23EE3